MPMGHNNPGSGRANYRRVSLRRRAIVWLTGRGISHPSLWFLASAAPLLLRPYPKDGEYEAIAVQIFGMTDMLIRKGWTQYDRASTSGLFPGSDLIVGVVSVKDAPAPQADTVAGALGLGA